MPQRRRKLNPAARDKVLAQIRQDRAKREQGYREQALRVLPHVCARCGREFSGARLRELTVHHIDHDHMNNPPDGSNWELLCLYCHDNEHQDPTQRGPYDRNPLERSTESSLGFQAFEGLKDLVQGDDTESPEDA